ncbi:MAG: hypothetical protein LBT27_02600, partial [Prevotellaceae bacterium]|nr:hypothetical protein [Prevotellaceae bacterium]
TFLIVFLSVGCAALHLRLCKSRPCETFCYSAQFVICWIASSFLLAMTETEWSIFNRNYLYNFFHTTYDLRLTTYDL